MVPIEGFMAENRKTNPCFKECPSRRFIQLIGDKWALLVLHSLANGPRRNGQMMNEIQGISQKMLTQTIRKLEINGLVARHDFKTIPPKVEYTLTEFGNSFREVLTSLDDWLDEHIPDLLALPA